MVARQTRPRLRFRRVGARVRLGDAHTAEDAARCQHWQVLSLLLLRPVLQNRHAAERISYIRTKQGFLYLSIIRDLYDNSIVAYKTGSEQSTKLVLDTIRSAKRKEKVTAELQLHSDQGFQYTSQAYFKLTQQYGMTPSMSRRGNPYDNALAENFFSILKTECIYRTKIETLSQAKELIDDYIFFYNNQRIQSKMKLTPLELRRQYVA